MASELRRALAADALEEARKVGRILEPHLVGDMGDVATRCQQLLLRHLHDAPGDDVLGSVPVSRFTSSPKYPGDSPASAAKYPTVGYPRSP